MQIHRYPTQILLWVKFHSTRHPAAHNSNGTVTAIVVMDERADDVKSDQIASNPLDEISSSSVSDEQSSGFRSNIIPTHLARHPYSYRLPSIGGSKSLENTMGIRFNRILRQP